MHKEILSGLIVFLCWFGISITGFINPIYFATPGEVFNVLVGITNNNLILDSLFTFQRIVLAIIISSIIGIPSGLFLAHTQKAKEYAQGTLDFFRSIPPIVFYPLALIILGPFDSSRIAVAVFGSVIVTILIITHGVPKESQLRKDYFRSIGAKNLFLRDVAWFQSLPSILTALKTSTSLTIIIIIVTEMLVGAQYGLGSRVQNVQITGNIPDLFATIIVIGLIGLAFNKIISKAENKIIHWA